MRVLKLVERNLVVTEAIVYPALGRWSPVKEFHAVAHSWTDNAVTAMCKFVKDCAPNLAHLHLACADGNRFGTSVRYFERVLGRYNYTLARLELRPWSGPDQERTVRDLLERNRGVRIAVEQLHKRHQANDEENRIRLKRSVLPAVLERIGPFPTLVYRFVRWGDVRERQTVPGVH